MKQNFIVFEGVDGCGKSTIMKAVAAKLTEQGFDVVCTREPGGSPVAEQIREVVCNKEVDVLEQALLFTAARVNHMRTVIYPALMENKIVLCDRFILSTAVYQENVYRELPNIGAESLMQQGIVFWLNIDPNLAATRIVKENNMDNISVEQLTEYNKRYEELWKYNGNLIQRIDIDEDDTVDEIVTQVMSYIQKNLNYGSQTTEAIIDI